jgi:hypothetical protein
VNLKTENHTSFSEKRIQKTGLIIIIFVAGMIVGITLCLQFTNDSSNASQSEELEIKNANIWVMTDEQDSQAAVFLVNEGITASKIKEITVRGVECSWSDVYYWTANIGSVTGELELSAKELSGSLVPIEVDGEEQVFERATGEISLDAYQTMILYINDPGNLTPEDAPSQVIIAVFTERDMYSQEVSIDRVIKFQGSSSTTVTEVQFTGGGSTILLKLKNSGTNSVTISSVKVNNSAVSFTGNMTSSDAGDTGSLELTAGWVPGNPYNIDLYASNGQVVGSYVATASG